MIFAGRETAEVLVAENSRSVYDVHVRTRDDDGDRLIVSTYRVTEEAPDETPATRESPSHTQPAFRHEQPQMTDSH